MNARILRNAILLAIGAIVLGIIASSIWFILYAAAIEPGHQMAFYQDYAIKYVDRIGLIVGIPIMLGAGWLIGRSALTGGEGAKRGAILMAAYIVIDLLLLFALSAGQPINQNDIALSYVTKLAAAVLGGWLAGRAVNTEIAEPIL